MALVGWPMPSSFYRRAPGLCRGAGVCKGPGELHLRPIHGDPKITNVMIDNFTGKGTAIVDLDTVKPGLIHYDFGDAVRSGVILRGRRRAIPARCFWTSISFAALVRVSDGGKELPAIRN